MLKFAEPSEFPEAKYSKVWAVGVGDLKAHRHPAPHGFHFAMLRSGCYYWTSDRFAALLLFKSFKYCSDEVLLDFIDQERKDAYLHELSYSVSSPSEFRKPDGLEYRPHQKAGIEYCLSVKNVLIADQQRLGKTAIAIGVVNNLPVSKVLVLCPKTAKANWLAELHMWLCDPHKIQILTSQSEVDEDCNVYVANYDILHILPALQQIQFDIVIADECHLVSRLETRRAKFFLALSAKKIIAMSGTPLLNNPKDLLSIVQWLDKYWNTFSYKNGAYVTYNNIKVTLEEMQDLLRSSLMIRRLQAQVFDSDPVESRIVTIDAPPGAKEYVEAELRKLEDYTRVRKVLGLYKVDAAINHISTYTSEGEKIVVFAYHKAVLDRLHASLGNKSVLIYGDSSDDERTRARHRFDTDPSCLVMLGSIPAASMAINLSVAAHILFVECDWSNGLMDQAKERCSDKLQSKQVIIEYLVFQGSLDERILSKINSKDSVVDRGVDLLY